MRIFGLEISRARTVMPGSPGPGSGGWLTVVREPTIGAWQRNEALAVPSVLSYSPVYACVSTIAQDVGKLPLLFMEQDANGIWHETTNPAFSPVLRKPNRYQTTQKFLEQWILSKLIHGNTYVLKQRDARQVVIALYVLDPQKVKPLVTPDGAIYYELQTQDLAGVQGPITIPAREIIHDLMPALFHQLVGISPLFACWQIAHQGLMIQENSTNFFANGSSPSGVLMAPGEIQKDQAEKIRVDWETKYTGTNSGKVAVLQNGLKYEPLSVNAVDAELTEQMKKTVEMICAAFHIPAALIDSSHQPPYANSEPLVQQYYAQCLQCLTLALESALDEGLGLGPAFGNAYGTALDIDALIWMDTATRTKAATEAVVGGVLSPNEARAKYFGLGPVPGGDSPYLQQQQFSLRALAERDAAAPFATPVPPPPAAEAPPEEPA